MVGIETLTTSSVGSTFIDKNVATGKTVTINSAILGAGANGGLASNYSLTTGQTTTANITAKALNATATVANKVYDGNPTASSTLSLSGMVGTETLTTSSVGSTFIDKNVATGKTVTINSASLTDGTDANAGLASNYSLATDDIQTANANITAKDVTASGLTRDDKTYDGTLGAGTITGQILTGLIGDDEVTVSATGAFNNKDVEDTKIITLTGHSYGGDAANYNITDQATITDALIAPKALTVSDLSVDHKTYNGALDATLDGTAELSGLLGSDTVTIDQNAMTGTFLTKDVGIGKTVNVSGITLSGAQAINYSVGQQASLNANITAKALTVSGLTVSDKEYDGNKFAVIDTANLERDGLVVGDDVTMDPDTTKTFGTFVDANVGVDKSITLTSAYLGDDVGNYTITDQATINVADISAKVLTAVFIAADKVYDGMKTANATLFSLTGMLDDETLTVSSVGSTFSDKNVSDNKIVSINSYTLVNGVNGGLALNYSLAPGLSAQADISAKTLTVSGLKATNKVYDGNDVAALTGDAVVTILGGDSVTLGGTAKAVFDNESIGTDKSVTVLGNALSGTDAANYTLIQQAGLTADIIALSDEIISTKISLPQGCTLVTSQGALAESGIKQKSRRGVIGPLSKNLNDLNMSGSKILKCG